MPEVCSQPSRSLRLVRRISGEMQRDITIRPTWPSAFTTQPLADAQIVDEGEGILTLQVGSRCFAVIQGLHLDQHSLNHLLDRMRHQPPRRRR